MNKSNHRTYHHLKILGFFAILLLLYLCYINMNRQEISSVDLVRIIAIDKSSTNYLVTAIYTDAAGSGDSTTPLTISGSGDTVYAAFENLKLKNRNPLTIAHTNYYLVSDTVCKGGLLKGLDYIVREHTTKTNASVYLLPLSNIHDFILRGLEEERNIISELQAIDTKQRQLLKKTDNTLLDVLNALSDNKRNLLLPYLTEDNQSLYITGYAVFKGDSLYQYLSTSMSSLLDLARNRVRSYPIYLSYHQTDQMKNLTDSDSLQAFTNQVNSTIALEITKYKCNIDVSNKGNDIITDINLEFDTDIKEATSQPSLYEKEEIRELTTRQNQYMQSQFAMLTGYMKTHKVDLLDIENRASQKYKEQGFTSKEVPDFQIETVNFRYTAHSQLGKNYMIETGASYGQ
ncbi:Ger(x)C family spore germination C-terminal domain-containing protein [Lachnoclostridium phytofermentans]|uniref:Ger(x)C family spore germination protein n=1 Tax=Lachnoclostridium phytofermentans TaxID=66219 RepID=UPI000497799F|nr:Ger(x)C family spore germination C-terminal domain-containing protein [Lachnoclostridium phytofermentans]